VTKKTVALVVARDVEYLVLQGLAGHGVERAEGLSSTISAEGS
jgi:hypothetical protein